MRRQTGRARSRDAGFSMVELLVTIVIAGIVFAAMVPVFVAANQKNGADLVRVQAANVAQDKIEKIRQLSYGSIAADKLNPTTTPNLYNPDFADRQFGPSTPLNTGTGTRTIYTDYDVQVYPAAASGLTSQYKLVTVTAYWTAPPAPVKKVVLQTIVYRQYSGPPINDFSTNPVIGVTGVIGDQNLTSITLSAHVDLTSGVTPAKMQFAISAYGGQTIASQLVNITDTDQTKGYWYVASGSSAGTFFWTWDCSTAANTVYDLQATAFSKDGYAGNTPHLYPVIQHTLAPMPPGPIVATPGDRKVSLAWGLSPDSLLARYQVYRSTNASGPWDASTLIATVNAPATTYTDPTAGQTAAAPVNGTTYYYAVRAVTSETPARQSVAVVSPAVTPANSADTSPPGPPGSVTATAAPAAATITLTWTSAADVGTGVQQYEIWRSADGVSWGTLPLTVWTNLLNLSYDDASAGWNTTWYYRIRGIDGALNAGAFSSIVSAKTVQAPFHDLVISVKNGNNACNVWVLQAKPGGHYYDLNGNDKGTTSPAGTPIAKNSSVTFKLLPDGPYTVYASTGGSPTGATTYGVTVQAPQGTLSGVTP